MVVQWIGDAKFVAKVGDSGLTGNIYTGLLEFAEMSCVLHALRPKDVFIDAGANAGSYTILASKVVGAHTYAFEPVPETYSRLLVNVDLNMLSDLVEAHNIGLAAESGALWFSNSSDSTNHVVDTAASRSNLVKVDVDTLDHIVSGTGLIMKVDVEGFEYPILRGATRQLSDGGLAAVILELNGSGENYGYKDSDCIALLQKFGFLPFEYNPFDRKLSPLTGKNEKSPNTIFVRDLERLEKRLRNATAFRVNGRLI